MIEYPSISDVIQNIHIIAFNKLDGNNIRSEWTLKNGFCKFGTRTRLLGPDEYPLSKSISMIPEKYDELNFILKKNRFNKATCFFEFWGENSAFGIQDPNDIHNITLIDVFVEKNGFFSPKEYTKLFGKLDIADILYEGNCNSMFVESVKNGTLEGLGTEGVVCKGKLNRKTNIPIMFKVKRDDWYDRLRKHCGSNDEMFKKLS